MSANLNSIERQASLYLFDLQNLAAERGRMTNDEWQIQQATAEEKVALEKRYQYTLSNKVHMEELPELLNLVRQKLNMAVLDKSNGTSVLTKEDANYLIAFHKEHIKK